MRIYTLLLRKTGGTGVAMSFTNLKQLCEFTGEKINYNQLLHHFTRKKLVYYENPYENIVIIRSIDLVKGRQRVIKKSKGHNDEYKPSF